MPSNISSNYIIPEIGYNHLGSLFNLRAMMDLLANKFNCFTVQLREDNFPEKDYLHIENDKVIAVSLNSVPEIPSMKIRGRKTATKIKVVAIIANEICLDPL